MKQQAQNASVPAERQCRCCGQTLSLNFFGLDAHECRRCESRQQAEANKTLELSA